MPKGVRMLEGMSDLHKKFRILANVKTNISSMQYELINLGTEAEPKYVSMGKCYLPGEWSRFINLFKQYKDIFFWTYEDLNRYDIHIIQHSIPIKIGIKPFHQ